MADLTNYEGLKAAVEDYLGRKDLKAQIPTFIRLAEKRMDRDVRLRCQERRAVCDIDAGARGIKLSAQREPGKWNVFVEMRDLVWTGIDGTIKNLQYLAPDTYRVRASLSGAPTYYTIISDDLFLMPVPECDGRLEMAYYAEIPPLSDNQPDNPVLLTAPDLYLYASLLESVPFTRGSVPAQEWLTAYNEAVSKLARQEQHARFTANLKMQHVRRI